MRLNHRRPSVKENTSKSACSSSIRPVIPGAPFTDGSEHLHCLHF